MAIKVRTDIFAMDAIRGLSKSSKDLSEVYTQLASGSRINKASDDAAGLAIASKLNADSRVFSQGIKNVNDGISVLQIASNAISSLKDITIRRQELAEQSANGVYSNKQRESLNKEFYELSSEYQRIISTTQFNGLELFEGGLNGLSLQLAYSELTLDFGDLFDEMKNLGVYPVGYSPVNSHQSIVASTNGGYSMDVALGDLNGDGILDMVVSDYGTAAQCTNGGYSNTVSVSMGKGDGSFENAVYYQLGVGSRPHNVSLADINGDSKLDIVADTAQNDVIYLMTNNGNGTFNTSTTFDPGLYVLNGVATGDINGDGNADIISTGKTSGTYGVYVSLNNGSGGFSANATGTSIGSYAAFTMAVGDLNGDGKDDVVTANRAGKSFSVLKSNGSNVLGAANTYNVGEQVNDVAIGDLDGDGKDDIAVAAGNSVYIYKQNNDGTFSKSKTLAAGKTVTAVEIADINNDGTLDIVSAQGGENSVSIFMGKGSLEYTQQKAFVGDGPVSLALGDLNNDGNIDAAIANSKGSSAQSLVACETYLDVSTQETARNSLDVLGDILSRLSICQGKIGGVQSRLETAVQVMQVSKENYNNAASTIMDVDVAEASSKLIRQNILQQVSSSILAHSKMQADVALSLLSFNDASFDRSSRLAA